MKRTPRKAPLARSAARPARPPGMQVAAARRLALLVLWAATLVGLAYGLHRLEPYARATAGDGTWRLDWATQPSDDWIRAEIEHDCLSERLRNMHLLAPDLCERVGQALARSGWIETVERVSRQPDGIVKVRARFRKYVTFVLCDGTGYLVDGQGVRLNRTESARRLEAEQVARDMIYLEGVQPPPPAVGQAWPGDDVLAGLALVQFLQDQCFAGLRASLVAVDVSNFGYRLSRRDGMLRLRTVRPTLVLHWGLPPGQENGIESSAADKLARLWTIYSEYGQLPDQPWIDLRPLETVDIPRGGPVP